MAGARARERLGVLYGVEIDVRGARLCGHDAHLARVSRRSHPEAQVRHMLAGLEGLESIAVKVVSDPPWDPSRQAKVRWI